MTHNICGSQSLYVQEICKRTLELAISSSFELNLGSGHEQQRRRRRRPPTTTPTIVGATAAAPPALRACAALCVRTVHGALVAGGARLDNAGAGVASTASADSAAADVLLPQRVYELHAPRYGRAG